MRFPEHPAIEAEHPVLGVADSSTHRGPNTIRDLQFGKYSRQVNQVTVVAFGKKQAKSMAVIKQLKITLQLVVFASGALPRIELHFNNDYQRRLIAARKTQNKIGFAVILPAFPKVNIQF